MREAGPASSPLIHGPTRRLKLLRLAIHRSATRWRLPTTRPNFANQAGRYNFGNINSVLRVDQTISPTWVVNVSYTYNMAHFNYAPAFNNYTIQDRTVSPYISYYVGGYEPTKSDDYSLNLSTQKIANFLGQHTLSVGYTYEHTNFLDQYNSRTGANYAIPANNAAGDPINVGTHTAAVGKMTNATFRLYPADLGLHVLREDIQRRLFLPAGHPRHLLCPAGSGQVALSRALGQRLMADGPPY